MLTFETRRLSGITRSLLFGCLLLLTGITANGQTYNPPSCCTVSNKAYGPGQPTPTDGRSMFYDLPNFVMRDYNGTAEVLSYLTPQQFRAGHYPIYVHSGGTLNPNGTWTGGVTNVYWFKNGVADSNLVQWNTTGGAIGLTLPPLAYQANTTTGNSTPIDTAHISDINILDMPGVKGDSSTDCTAGIQLAIDIASGIYGGNQNGGSIYIPAGNYITTATLHTYPGHPLRIHGDNHSGMTYYNNFARIVNGKGGSFIINNSATDTALRISFNGAVLENFGVRQISPLTTTTCVGIYFDSATEARGSHLLAQGFDQGFYIRQGVHYVFSDLAVADNHSYSYHFDTYANPFGGSGIDLDAGDGRIEYCSGYGTVVSPPTSWLGIGMFIEGGGGLQIRNSKLGTIVADWKGYSDLVIDGNSIESVPNPITIICRANSTLGNMHITNNQLKYTGNNGILIIADSTATSAQWITITGNIITGNYPTAIDTGINIQGFGGSGPIYIGGDNMITTVARKYFASLNVPLVVGVPHQQQTISEAARMHIDLWNGDFVNMGLANNGDTIDLLPNSAGPGIPFEIQVGAGATVNTITLAGGASYNFAQVNTASVNMIPGLTYVLHCVTTTASNFIVKGVDHNYTANSVPYFSPTQGMAYDAGFAYVAGTTHGFGIGVQNPLYQFHQVNQTAVTGFADQNNAYTKEFDANGGDLSNYNLIRQRISSGTASAPATAYPGQMNMHAFSYYGGAWYEPAYIGSRLEPTRSGANLPATLFIATYGAPGCNTCRPQPFVDGTVRWLVNSYGQHVFTAPNSPKSDTLPQGGAGTGYGVTIRGTVYIGGDSVAMPTLPYNPVDTTNFKPVVKNASSGLFYRTDWTTSSGIYVPTLVDVAGNTTTLTADSAVWSRVGSVVTVSGKLTLTPNGNSVLEEIGISLPIASLLNGGHACWGQGTNQNSSSTGASTGIAIVPGAGTGAHQAELAYTTGTAASGQLIGIIYSFQYQIQ